MPVRPMANIMQQARNPQQFSMKLLEGTFGQAALKLW